MTVPLLSIAIPTYKRAGYLSLTLRQLHAQIVTLPPNSVEVVVSDNASPDETPEVVAAAIAGGLDIRSVRNRENIGSDANIAQVFNLSSGRHVLILGDDDVLLAGALDWLLQCIAAENYGVIFLRPYGYSADFEAERPGSGGRDERITDAGRFLEKIGPLLTLISACVINKGLLGGVDANEFCGGNLVQVHLALQAVLLADANLYSSRWWVACKRNNSGGYDRSQVFVYELGRILDSYRNMGLTTAAIRRFEMRMMLGYHPYYLFIQRKDGSGDLAVTYRNFVERYGDSWFFWLWLAPIMRLPRPLALAWGAATTAAGRGLSGDLRRGFAFLRDRNLRRGSTSSPTAATPRAVNADRSSGGQ